MAAFAEAVSTGPFVFGSYIPRSWHLATLLTLVGLAALIVSSCTRANAESLDQLTPRTRLHRVGVASMTVAAVLVATGALLMTGFAASVTSYHVLEPAGPQGCRVVVAEDTSLLLGSGRIFVLSAGSHRAQQVATFTADDGYRPISLGTYELTWNGNIAELAPHGDEFAPVSYEQTPLTCPH